MIYAPGPDRHKSALRAKPVRGASQLQATAGREGDRRNQGAELNRLSTAGGSLPIPPQAAGPQIARSVG